MMEQIIQDLKENRVTRSAACVALFMIDPETHSNDIAHRLNIPKGTVSSIKSIYLRGKYKYIEEAKKYADRITTPEPKPPVIEEISAPLVLTPACQMAEPYIQVMEQLDKLGLYRELLPLCTTKEVMIVLDKIVSFIDEASVKKHFRVPRIFTLSLKAIARKEEFDEIADLTNKIRVLESLEQQRDKLQAELDNIDSKVLELFKNGNPESMSKLYSKHKNITSQLNELKQQISQLRAKVEQQTKFVESVLSAKIPQDK